METISCPEKPLWMIILQAGERIREEALRYALQDDSDSLFDLTYSQQRIMWNVKLLTDENPEGISLKVLADAVGLASGTASSLVECLVKKNLLARLTSPHDRRAVCIRMTAKGSEFLERGHSYIMNIIDPFFRRVPAGEMNHLYQILSELLTHIDAKKRGGKDDE